MMSHKELVIPLNSEYKSIHAFSQDRAVVSHNSYANIVLSIAFCSNILSKFIACMQWLNLDCVDVCVIDKLFLYLAKWWW